MTKKDFEAIAAVIRREMRVSTADGGTRSAAREGVCRCIAAGIAGHAATRNKSFDRARFFAACGIST